MGKQAAVDPGAALGDVCQQLGWATFQDELESLFEKTDGTTLQRHARLLADFTARADSEPDRQALCLALAKALLCAIEAWEPSKEERRRASESWGRPAIDRRALLLDFTQALLALDAAPLLRRLVDYALDRREDFDFTTVQIPALLTVAPALSQISKRTAAALKHWLKTIEKDLESRANRPPQRPLDWRRAPAVGCKCRDCATLSEFLQDPISSRHGCRCRRRRRHLHAVIDCNSSIPRTPRCAKESPLAGLQEDAGRYERGPAGLRTRPSTAQQCKNSWRPWTSRNGMVVDRLVVTVPDDRPDDRPGGQPSLLINHSWHRCVLFAASKPSRASGRPERLFNLKGGRSCGRQ